MRTTVASLVPVSSARPVTVRAAQPAGSAATASATRCMERVIEGARVRTLAARAAGAGGGRPGCHGERRPLRKFPSRLGSHHERYFPFGVRSRVRTMGDMDPPARRSRHGPVDPPGAGVARGTRPGARRPGRPRGRRGGRRLAGRGRRSHSAAGGSSSGRTARTSSPAWSPRTSRTRCWRRYGRWPLCPVCDTGDPHALEVEPELGPDPHWVCHKAGVRVAAVGALGAAGGAASS